MGRKRVYIFLAAICLNCACSREPRSTPAVQSAAAKPTAQAPTYSAASIVPSGAMQPAPLAPGRVASIYGAGLGPAQPCHGSPDPNRRETPNPLRPHQTLIETQVFPG